MRCMVIATHVNISSHTTQYITDILNQIHNNYTITSLVLKNSSEIDTILENWAYASKISVEKYSSDFMVFMHTLFPIQN